MNDAAKQNYVFHCLTLIDMERATTSLEWIGRVKDTHLQEALFRDAVICYAKCFSSNKDVAGRSGLRLCDAFVPTSLIPIHREVLNLRNQLFAHVDLDNQAPNVSVDRIDGKPHVSFSIRGYARVFTEHLIEPLNTLSKKAHSYCMNEIHTIESRA